MTKLGLRITLVTVALLATVFSAGAQDQRLNLSGTQMSVSNILLQIRQQTNFGVAYRTDQIHPERVVTLPSQDVSLRQAIDLISAGTGTKGEIDGNIIVFLKENPAPIPETSAFKPTPLSEFRESLGLRPQSVVLESDPSPREMLVEVPLPQESHRLPAAGYTANQGALPVLAVKTNLLYGLGLLTPNLSLEVGLGKKTSLEVGGSYSWKGLNGRTFDDNAKRVHMIIKPEFRYWLCERFDGHFFGVHALYTRYNIGSYRVPLLFDRQYRYDGYGVGGGITYGYNWAFAKRWGLEFAIGAGVVQMKYDRYDCEACSRNGEPLKKTYFGPTNAAVTLSFLIK